MKNHLMWLAVSCCPLLPTVIVDAQTRHGMADPIFGISYDIGKVRFEYAPDSISRLCKYSKGRRPWLYGYLKAGDTEYFVLSDWVTEVSGEGTVLQRGKCTEGLPDWVLSGDYAPQKMNSSIKFSDDVLRQLAKDVLRRYSKAFGGKQAFLRELKSHGLQISDFSSLLVFHSELEAFVKSP